MLYAVCRLRVVLCWVFEKEMWEKLFQSQSQSQSQSQPQSIQIQISIIQSIKSRSTKSRDQNQSQLDPGLFPLRRPAEASREAENTNTYNKTFAIHIF